MNNIIIMRALVCTVTLLSVVITASAQDKANSTKASESKVTYGPSVFIGEGERPIETILADLQKSDMPVAKLPNHDKAMPVVKTDRTQYNMPVMGKTQPRAGDRKLTIDSLPAVKKP